MSGAAGAPEASEAEVQALFRRLDDEAEKGGYHLNPNTAFTLGLVRGLIVNEKRYGYRLCPCRLTEAGAEEDLDIVCPCDYRDPDLAEYGCCYCSLYVSQEIPDGKKRARRIPERRPERAQRLQFKRPEGAAEGSAALDRRPGMLSYPVWRCRVCGYICARDGPPESCPICRAKKDRFERFM
jgi:ferredoxin-thioredoxin reductase catalytic subunit